MIIYGRNPVKEALRGRRKHAVKEVWATAGVAREPWLEGVRVKSACAEEVQRTMIDRETGMPEDRRIGLGSFL